MTTEIEEKCEELKKNINNPLDKGLLWGFNLGIEMKTKEFLEFLLKINSFNAEQMIGFEIIKLKKFLGEKK